MGLADAFGAEDRVQVKFSDFYKLMKQATQYEIAMNAVGCDVPHRYIRECITGVKEPQKQGIQIELENPANKSMMSARKDRSMDRTLKAVYIWIVLALVWMGLELLLYSEIQPRTVDDIMWFLFLPFIYMAVN